MASVRYIFLSDLHFGERNSILTDPEGPEPGAELLPNDGFEGLVACLHDVARSNADGVPPRLVLLGDIFELALAPRHEAFESFARFAEQLFPDDGAPLLDPRLVFVPGNHDHDLWTSTRDDLLNQQIERCGGRLRPTAPVTTTFDLLSPSERMEVVPSRCEMLTRLLRRRLPHLPGIEVQVGYPNVGITDGERAIVAHHGHFMDDVYLLMTTLSTAVYGAQRPLDLGRLEEDNAAWIDFVWSSLGREGALAAGLRRSYDLLQSESGRILLSSRIAAALADALPLRFGQRLRQRALLPLVLRLIDALDHTDVRRSFTREVNVTPEVVGYLDGLLAASLREELRLRAEEPSEFTYVYGHSHKPLAQTAWLPQERRHVAVYNTGGWVVDTNVPRPTTSGGMLLADDRLDTVLVTLGRQVLSPHQEMPQVASALAPDGALFRHVESLITRSDGPWRRTAAALGGAILRRRAEHGARLLREVDELGAYERLALRTEYLWKLIARRRERTQAAIHGLLATGESGPLQTPQLVRENSPLALQPEAHPI